MEDKIKLVLEDISGYTEIKNSDDIFTDLLMDEIDLLDAITELEEEFNVEMPDSLLYKIETVQHIINFFTDK